MDYCNMIRNILLKWNRPFEEIENGKFMVSLAERRVLAIGFIKNSIGLRVMEPEVYKYSDRRKTMIFGRKAASAHNVKYDQSEKQPAFILYIVPENSDEEELSKAIDECRIDLEAAMDDFNKYMFRTA